MSMVGEKMVDHLPHNIGQAKKEVSRSLKSSPFPLSHTGMISVSHALSCSHMEKGGWRVEVGTEHICHLFARP